MHSVTDHIHATDQVLGKYTFITMKSLCHHRDMHNNVSTQEEGNGKCKGTVGSLQGKYCHHKCT